MKFEIEQNIKSVIEAPVVGNVYNVRGGSGAKYGYMIVIVAIMETTVTYLTVNKDGEIVSGGNYGIHYFEDKCPMAYCSGMDQLSFVIGSIK